jgi:hypothetical protein
MCDYSPKATVFSTCCYALLPKHSTRSSSQAFITSFIIRVVHIATVLFKIPQASQHSLVHWPTKFHVLKIQDLVTGHTVSTTTNTISSHGKPSALYHLLLRAPYNSFPRPVNLNFHQIRIIWRRNRYKPYSGDYDLMAIKRHETQPGYLVNILLRSKKKVTCGDYFSGFYRRDL